MVRFRRVSPAWNLLLGGLAASALVSLSLLLRLLARSGQLRRANRALSERNQALEAAAQAKTRFVASLAHELRNPLSAVIGYSELMGAGRCGPLGERAREHVSIVRDSAGHMLNLIDELLDVARIEAGQLRLETAPVDPAGIARGCIAALRATAERREIQIALDAPGRELVLLDPTRLRQVVLNYLSNAIKFSPPGSMVAMRLWREPDGLRVEVTDAGPGLSPADQSRVFGEFFQVEGTERSGTGLGLAVTRVIVEAQGGHVAVRSRPGHGSTFMAWIPAAEIEVPVQVGDQVELQAVAELEDALSRTPVGRITVNDPALVA